MRTGWIALTVCAGLVGGLVWATSTKTEAAMVIGDGKMNMSVIETVAKKSKKQCTDYLFWVCCTAPGKAEVCSVKKM
jgi:hypothetical protein